MANKIRITMEKMSLSVEVGDNANFLFMKMANELLCHAIGKENAEAVANKLESHEYIRSRYEASPVQKVNRGKTEEESENQLTYRGLIYWKCQDCGFIKGFCLRKESKGIHCMNCGSDHLFKEPLKLISAKCECGQTYKYMTNMDEEMFDMPCMVCRSPIPIKWNKDKKEYQTIQ